MIKDIKYNGYSAQPSDYESSDGDLALSLNLINEDGNLRPIQQPDPKDIGLSPSQSPVFIHRVSDHGKNFIVYDSILHRLWWKDGESTHMAQLGYTPGLSHCNAVGNTLIVCTDSEIHYYLWQDTCYTDLGNSLPHISVSFGLVGHPRLFSQSHERFTFEFPEGIEDDKILSDFSDANKSRITENVMAKLNLFIREQTVDKGRFCFPFFIRYALRMYDGSLVCHSAPILMNPSTNAAPLVFWHRLTGRDNYEKAEDCDIMLVAADIDYQVVHDNEYQRLSNWKDLVKSIDVFISKPIYTYDQNGTIDNFMATDTDKISFVGKLYHKMYHEYGSIKFSDEVSEDNMAGPITVNSSSASLNFFDRYCEWNYSQIYRLYFTNDPGRPIFPRHSSSLISENFFRLPAFSNSRNTENIESCASFYLLHSIPLDDARRMSRTPIHVDDDYLQSLTSREVMTDDYLSNDRLVASSSLAYNSRLNLSGVSRHLFKGFSPLAMFARCDRQTPAFSISDNAGSVFITPSAEYDSSLSATVYVREAGNVVALESDPAEMAPWGSVLAGANIPRSWGAFLFYPNPNAFKIVINTRYAGQGSGSADNPAAVAIDLRPHDFLNGAYAFVGYNNTRVRNIFGNSLPEVTAPGSRLIDSGNKVYTSEINNPFFFPLLGINSVGSGRIRAISTAAKALSQGQFGQFPLYAFTDEGVWALEISATGSYSARQPITRDVILANTEPLQMDSAVLFATDRGIMLISGSQTQCITDVINSGKPFDVLQLPGMATLHAMLGHEADTCLPTAPFLQYISECGMLYDYVHQRVIVYNPDYTYAYVYSLKSKEWGMMYSTIEAGINSYPEALAVDHDGALLNFSSMDGKATKGLFVSRPLKLETPDVLKTMDTVIQRGHFQKGHVQSVLYGSRDLFNWHLIWSSKGHYLRGFRGTPYKYFRIACVTSLSDDESIFGASLQFNPRQTNQPR